MGFVILLTLALAQPTVRVTPVRFNRDIRPIMSDTCFRCHGPDQRSRQAGMRLDIRDEALKATRSGVTPIVPGDPGKSAIITRIFAPDVTQRMPPENAHRVLTPTQKETIRRWVAEGAVYEGHWAYQALKRPVVPDVAAKNPVDAFVLERLQREHLTPSPVADKRTLLRRVSFDLTGLPPTPAELAAFVADTSTNAYEKVVDRLLASPAYAEQQTMHWLDAVRYGDSAGFHGDNLMPAWPYRDYVLRAFRDNKPFDQFTREQLAGDLIPDATLEQKVASAYNRMGRTSAEGGLQAAEYLAKYGGDRVRTVSTVWLGTTVGCAECHNHRFDPIKAKDFYALKAFFADIKETGLIDDRGASAWGTKLALPSPAQEAGMKRLNAELLDAKAKLSAQTDALKERRWLWEDVTLKKYDKLQMAWQYQRPISAKSEHGATVTVYNDSALDFNYYLSGSLVSEHSKGEGLVIASGPNPDNETYTIALKPGAGTWVSLGIDVFQDESLPGSRLARGADRFVLTEVDASLDGRKLPIVLATSGGFGETPEHPAMAAIDGNPKTGWAVSYGEARNPFLALRFGERVTTTDSSVITVRLHHDSDYRRATLGRFRLALSPDYSWPEDGDSGKKNGRRGAEPNRALLMIATDLGLPSTVATMLRVAEQDRNDTQRRIIGDHFAWASPELTPLYANVARIEAERSMLDASIPRVVYTERTKPRITRILARGNFLDDTGDIVEPAIPEFLGKLETPGREATRLDLANWIVSPENPLTARVFVNRLWREFFGTGLSKVLEDLGSQGEWPTHPELLDWLASEFAEHWDVKHTVRLIVTSATYQQASLPRAEVDERDPDNRLLARQSRFRVDAEDVHDTALAVAGLLVNEFGGPSAKPYEPEGYLTAMNFPKREYSASHGDELYRRALYTQWQRTFLHPSLAAFDAPSREECTLNRVNSNTPLQALVMLNDPIFVEASRVFAEHILHDGGKALDAQLDWAFTRALDRKPTVQERTILATLYRKDLARFQADPAAARELLSVGESAAATSTPELAAMATVARTILNLHEVITRN